MGAGARIEQAIHDITGTKVTTVIKDKLENGVRLTKRKANSVAGRTKSKAENLVFRLKLLVYNSIATLLTFVLIIALSFFFYGAFYYAYMPLQVHEHPVNLQFTPCDDNPGVCSYPSASMELNRKIKLMTGQPYSITVRLEVPESTVNQDLGMFMSCLQLHLADKNEVSSCQSAILQFRSQFLIYLETLAFSPFLVSGTSSQKQYVDINFYQKFYDDPHNPATKASIQIQSKFIQIYKSTVLIHAEFSGLRHIIYTHPWISTAVGVMGNFILLSTIILISWSRFFTDDRIEDKLASELIGDIDTDSDISLEEDDVFKMTDDPFGDRHGDFGEARASANNSASEEHMKGELDITLDNQINTLVENIK
eukprot:TRINITY_DN6039_c0_g1_i1.p1 TRINITY_DN6039_c0_g1~~TRINITY_DN6039_c0_g1_i1.p1  ORF type:complete len:366 (-),score=56.31 TRINITY_DN6039_c0_g1_i1:79-1176(-)